MNRRTFLQSVVVTLAAVAGVRLFPKEAKAMSLPSDGFLGLIASFMLRYLGIFVAWFNGAAADGVTDDTDALERMINGLQNDGTFVLGMGTYRITRNLVFQNLTGVKIDLRGTILADGCDGVLFDRVSFSEVHVSSVVAKNRDWTSGHYGVKVRNCSTDKFTFRKVLGFAKGVYLHGDDGGVGYIQMDLGHINNNEHGIHVKANGANGWVNEVNYVGGRLSIDSNVYAVVNTDVGVYFEAGPVNTYDNHRWYSPSLEGLHTGFYLAGSPAYLLLDHPRMEGVDMYVNGDGTAAYITWLAGYESWNHAKVAGISNGGLVVIGRTNYGTAITINGYSGLGFFDNTDGKTPKARIRYHSGNQYFEIIDQNGYTSKIGTGYMLNTSNNGFVGNSLKVRNGTGTVLWLAAAPTAATGTFIQGDLAYNVQPTELGVAGSKYTLVGWRCVAAGNPGTWVEMRCPTGN